MIGREEEQRRQACDVVTRVVWKQIEVNRTYMFCDCSAPSPLPPDSWRTFPLAERLTVVDRVYLPLQFGEPATSDLFYAFEYNADGGESIDPGWGEVSGVTAPSGASSAYGYEYDGDAESLAPLFVLSNGVATKTLVYALEYDGPTTQTSEEWAYDRTGVDTVTSASMTGPDGSVTTEYYTDGNSLVAGEVYKTVGPDGTVSEKLFSGNSPGAIAIGARANRYVEFEFVSPRDAGGSYTKTAVRGYVRDKNGNVTETSEYDYVAYGAVPRDGSGRPTGPASGATPVRITKTAFYNDTPSAASTTYNDADSYHVATSPRLLGLAKSVEVQNGSAAPKSRSEMTYDHTVYASNTIGGNLTQTKSWDSFKGGSAQSYSNPLTSTNSITTSATYNSYGMPLTTTDANNVTTQITYGSINGYADLYPTLTILAYGTSVATTSSAAYDFYTGVVTSVTGEDNDVTNATEYDDLGRPVKAITAYGTTLESWTQTEYHDADRYVVVKSDLETVGDGKKVAIQHYDQIGRVRLSRTLENASTEDPDDETDGIKVQTRYATTYSSPNGYNYQLTSNPYRAATSTAETDATMGWTRSKVWANGSQSQVESFAGAGLPAPWGSNSTSTGVVDTELDANATTVTDQAGTLRRSITNGLGQLIRVDEPNSSNQLGTVSSPNQATNYAYDTLNNLITVNQGSQQRDFNYSSISRLRTAVNPESGTITYGYDANGNLTIRLDARSITTNYNYDALNRVTQRTYATPNPTPNPSQYQNSPTVNYYYDNVTNAKGKLTKVESSVSTTEYTAFDILGRVTASKQTTDGGAAGGYATGYTYNLGGALIEETYPSGRVVKNTLDTTGDLQQVQSKELGAQFVNYANSFTYNAAGAVTAMRLGNGRWESTVFNSRLQPTQIGLGNSATDASVLKLEYGYGTTANNGNVQSQTITVPGLAQPFVQNYTYDELNRLKSATETNNSTQTWKQTYTFDRYGNRRFDLTGGNTTFPNPSCTEAVCNPTISTSNNRPTSTGWLYDAAGNTTRDGGYQTFTYDAENKQVEAKNSSSVTLGQYFYDGDGKRVKKIVPSTGEITVFVYDAAGKLIGEYSTIVASTEDAKVAYLTADHLGSPRINTDRDGNTTSRHDYHPFGEEIGTSQRTSALGYTADTVRKQFTGYERDGETGLDHAQSRMFAFASGRFSSPDNFLNDTRPIEPASWNLYVYVRNNPLNLVDPSGEQIYVGDITDAEDRKKLLKRLNATYGCASCVTIDDNGDLAVDVSGLSSDMKKATGFLTNAIKSTEKFIQVLVRNKDPNILFGQSHPAGGNVPLVGPSGEPITSVTGGAQRRNSIRITLDFADEENIVAGGADDIASFFDFVFAHEVSHFFPEGKKDPTTRGMRGDVDNPINEIRALQGRPLRAQYYYSTFGSMSMQQFGDAARNPDGTLRRGSDGIEVENRRVFVWLKRHRQ